MEAGGGVGALTHVPKDLRLKISPKEAMRWTPEVASENLMGRESQVPKGDSDRIKAAEVSGEPETIPWRGV